MSLTSTVWFPFITAPATLLAVLSSDHFTSSWSLLVAKLAYRDRIRQCSWSQIILPDYRPAAGWLDASTAPEKLIIAASVTT